MTATAKAVGLFNARISRIASSAKAAVEAVGLTSTGGRDVIDAAWSEDLESVKRLWPGAILKLSDGDGGATRFAYVPLKGSVKASERNGIQIKVTYTGAETGGEFWEGEPRFGDGLNRLRALEFERASTRGLGRCVQRRSYQAAAAARAGTRASR